MTTYTLRAGLPPLPDRFKHLPISPKGYPVPFFVGWVDGVPDFRAADAKKLARCVKENRCWLCGEVLGSFKAFVIGPMCSVNRISAEPPSHLECCEFAVKACPFLLHPNAVRRTANLPEDHTAPAGIMLEHNPGVMLVWVTKQYQVQRAGSGVLFKLGEPAHVTWYKEGRLATRAEALAGMAFGLPTLQAIAEQDGSRAKAELVTMARAAERWLPAGEGA